MKGAIKTSSTLLFTKFFSTVNFSNAVLRNFQPFTNVVE